MSKLGSTLPASYLETFDFEISKILDNCNCVSPCFMRYTTLHKLCKYIEKQKITHKQDYLCCLLIKAGYVAKIGKERKDNKGAYTYFVEYWKEED